MQVLRILVIGAVCTSGVLMAQTPAESAPAAPAQSAPAAKPQRVKVASKLMQKYLTVRVPPEYPEDARSRGIEGEVTLHIVIGKDGYLKSVAATSGPDALMEAAATAVGHWKYKPYLVDGQPVEVDTTVTVSFTLDSVPSLN